MLQGGSHADGPCQNCQPGPHWIDTCQAGDDTIGHSVANVSIDLPPFGDFPGPGDAYLLRLSGPVTISRSAPLDDSAQHPGLRPIDGHLDVIDTEIISMQLTGGGATLRAGHGATVHPDVEHSYGAIAELGGDPRLAESFFDVFFEIDLGGGLYGYNHTPLYLRDEIITCVPPMTILGGTPIPEPISIFTDPVGGDEIARLVMNPLHAGFVPTVSAWGLAVMALLVVTAATVVMIRRRVALA
jgi:hypothetical protein